MSAPRRRSRWYTIWASGQIAALLAALLCGGALAYLLTSAELNARAVVISGTSLSTPEEIAAAGGVTGHNLFTIDPQAVANRLIALPTVREAQVWSELPDRLVMRIVERQPALVWQVGGDYFLLDAAGFIIAVNPSADRQQGLARVTSHDATPLQVGEMIAAGPVQIALAILHRAAEVGLPITGIDYGSDSGFVVLVTDAQAAGRQIIIGGDTRLDDKITIAAEIYRTAPSWLVLNVTDPDRPFFPAR